jgi:hypothetical protein
MVIASFDDLLRAARAQAVPQRLLFVFAAAALPDDATAEERADFEAGEGGTLTPVMCVDKMPEELASFAALVEESREFGAPWDIVFVAALSGAAGRPPSGAEAEASLQDMVEAIKSGRIDDYIPFDGEGQPVQFA